MPNNDSAEFKKKIEDRINNKFPNFKTDYNDLIDKVGSPLINNFKRAFKGLMGKELNLFQLSVIVDANFIIGQVKGSVENNKPIEDSFIYKLASSGILKIYTPPKVLEEINRHIPRLLPNDSKKGIKYAMAILKYISIQEALWVDDWKKANKLIGQHDKDDVPFLALAFHKQSHAVLTNDNHFKKQERVKIWDIGQTKEITTLSKKGFFSLMVLGSGVIAIQALWETLCCIFSIVFEIVVETIVALYKLAKKGISLLTKIPKEIYIGTLLFIVLLAIFSKEFRSKAGELTVKTFEKLGELIIRIGDSIMKLIEKIADIVELIKPYATTFLEFASYFLFEYQIAHEEIQKIESQRARS